jgi:hypothetical protein
MLKRVKQIIDNPLSSNTCATLQEREREGEKRQRERQRDRERCFI